MNRNVIPEPCKLTECFFPPRRDQGEPLLPAQLPPLLEQPPGRVRRQGRPGHRGGGGGLHLLHVPAAEGRLPHQGEQEGHTAGEVPPQMADFRLCGVKEIDFACFSIKLWEAAESASVFTNIGLLPSLQVATLAVHIIIFHLSLHYI